MLWLSLYFARLPIDLLCRGAAAEMPAAVFHGGRVLQCNPAAARWGVRSGLSRNAARASIPGLCCRNYDPEIEKNALERLAGWAGRFSPAVSLEPPRMLLLEIGGSLKLFDGLENLCTLVRGDLKKMGYRAVPAVAPFPLAAALLARGGGARVTDPAALPARLGELPVTVLESDNTMLEELGVTRLADLLRLPRAGLARRFGPHLPDMLDRMLGRRPDPRRTYVSPPRFRARLELPAPARESEVLLFACHRLLQDLAATLIAQDRGVERFEFFLHSLGGGRPRLPVGLQKPGRDPRHWVHLLREHLNRLELAHPVESVELRADRLVALAATSADLFDGGFGQDDITPLLERLLARLGPQSVQGLGVAPDHRPERAWRMLAPGEGRAGEIYALRPLWLLPEPLRLVPPGGWRLHGPERIESGWWDGQDVARDYYLAETPDGVQLWIFRERRGERGWFLHGLFA